MKCDMVLAGVGGQGILSIAAVLGRAALKEGLHIKQTEVHGMAQRGGAVQSHLRISEQPIHSDVIAKGCADLILAMEPMEALRYLPWLRKDGHLVASNRPLDNLAAYPPLDEVLAALEVVPGHFLFDGFELASREGTPRSMNMAMLGAASPNIALRNETLEQAIADQFADKGAGVIDNNLRVFRIARNTALEHRASQH